MSVVRRPREGYNMSVVKSRSPGERHKCCKPDEGWSSYTVPFHSILAVVLVMLFRILNLPIEKFFNWSIIMSINANGI